MIGGFVYRGKRIKGLQGQYLFGDLCNGMVRRLTRTGKSVKVATLVASSKPVSFAAGLVRGDLRTLREGSLSPGPNELDIPRVVGVKRRVGVRWAQAVCSS